MGLMDNHWPFFGTSGDEDVKGVFKNWLASEGYGYEFSCFGLGWRGSLRRR